MKQALSAVLALLALAVMPLLAGKRIQMESTDLTKNTTTKQEILLDATRMKVDTADTVMMFLTAGGNKMVVVDKAKKEYMVLDEAALTQLGGQANAMAAQMEAAMKGIPPEQRAMVEQMMKGRGGMPAGAPVVVATTYAAKGSGNVNGFACANYDGTQSGQKVSEICAAQPSALGISASDFQVVQKMQDFTASLRATALAVNASGIAEKGLNGFAVRTTRYTNGKATSREDVKSVTEATLTDADFSTGAAKKVEMPGMGGRGR